MFSLPVRGGRRVTEYSHRLRKVPHERHSDAYFIIQQWSRHQSSLLGYSWVLLILKSALSGPDYIVGMAVGQRHLLLNTDETSQKPFP